MNISSIASAGMYQSLRRFEASAQRMASLGAVDPADPTPPVEPVDPAEEIIQQTTAKQSFSANLSVLRTGDDMTKRLLDIKV